MRAMVLGMVGLSVLALVGCGSESQDRKAQAEATLDHRQTVSTAMARYDGVLAGVRETIAGKAGTGAWTSVGEQSTDRCLEFGPDLSDLDAVAAKTPSFLAASIPEDRWAATLAAVKAGVASAGFTKEVVRQDSAGVHEVELDGPDGASIQLMSERTTVVSLISGCHRPDERAPDVEISTP